MVDSDVANQEKENGRGSSRRPAVKTSGIGSGVKRKKTGKVA